jgi:ATP-dependent Clp protease ATP-binding subunit ClpA
MEADQRPMFLRVGRPEIADLPFTRSLTPRAQRVLELSQREAERWGHRHVGTEHLLLALVAESGGIAGLVLEQLGVRNAVIRKIHEIVESPGYASSSNEARDRKGNLVGYMVHDEEGRCTVVKPPEPEARDD